MTDPSREDINEAYRSALSRLSEGLGRGWRLSEFGGREVAWRFFEWEPDTLPPQGWKVHVSAAASEAPRLLEAVVPVLLECRASFKLPCSVEAIVALNSGAVGDSQVGKVITIYPRSDREAARLVRAIDEVWPETAGPVVVSDLLLRPDGAVSLRYGGFGGDSVIVDPAGTYHHAIRRPDGSLVAEKRDLEGGQPEWAPAPPVEGLTFEAVDEWREIVVGGRRYFNLVAIHSGATSQVMFSIDIEGRRTVVLKIARRGVGGDLFGHDARDRLRNEYEVLREVSSEGGPVPRPIAFSDDDPAVLVLEDVPGKSLAALPRREQIDSLPLLAGAVARLHELGFAHCDLKPSNALRGDDTVWLIDLGLAAPRNGPRRFPGWSAGYTPPEGVGGRASAAADVYALGACLAAAVLGFDPGELPAGMGRILGLLQLAGSRASAELVRLLCDPDPSRRPSATVAAKLLRERLDEIGAWRMYVAGTHGRADDPRGQGRGFPQPGAQPPDQQWVRRSALQAALSTRGYKETGTKGCYWRNPHPSGDFAWEGINHGAAGVVLGLMSVDTALDRNDFEEDIISGAEWLTELHGQGGSAGLFTGDAGVALALLVAGRLFGREDLSQRARSRLARAASTCRRLDLFSGAAGVLWSGCLMADAAGERWPLDLVAPKSAVLLERAEERNGLLLWPDSADDTSPGNYLGAAHGTAGIAMALAIWGERLDDSEASDLARRAFLSLHANARSEDGALRSRADAPDSQPATAWCHGVAGYLWCLLQSRAAETSHDPLDEQIDWAVASVADQPMGSDASYCHGLSGQLELWRMVSGIDRHRALAQIAQTKCVRALRLVHQRRVGRAVWSVDDPNVSAPDLWNGMLGPATALALCARGRDDSILSRSWLRACAQPSSCPGARGSSARYR